MEAKIANKKKPIQETYYTRLSIVISGKYLGVLIDSKLSWNTQCKALCKKANSTLAFLLCNLHSCPKDVKEKCYYTFVRPILEYRCSIWDPHKSNQIESLEKN